MKRFFSQPIAALGLLTAAAVLIANAGVLGWPNGGMAQTLLFAAAMVAAVLAAVWAERELWRVAFRGRPWARNLSKAPVSVWFGLTAIIVFLLMGLLAPILAPYGETEIVGSAYAPPDDMFLFGTDQVGRDVWSRIIFGARNTIGIALITTVIAFLIGATAGMLAATLGRYVDEVLSRVVDLLMAIPQLIFALLALSILGTGIVNMILVIAILDSTKVFRLTRAVAQGIVAMDYIEAAKLRGEGLWYLIRREILPNATAPLVAEFGMRLSFVLLSIAALSFLGLGIQPPTADWASMVAESKPMISFGLIAPLIPGIFIAVLTISINLVVDWKLHQASGLKD